MGQSTESYRSEFAVTPSRRRNGGHSLANVTVKERHHQGGLLARQRKSTNATWKSQRMGEGLQRTQLWIFEDVSVSRDLLWKE